MLRGDLSAKEPSDVDRDGVEWRTLAADSGCDFHRYADVAFDGVFGTVRPSGLGGA